jgi:hypothetical protein
MSTQNDLQILSFPVAADYSAKQNYWMTLNGSRQAQLATTRGEACLGVLLDDPAAAGRVGAISVAGVTKCLLAGTIDEDDPITNDANGKTIKATLSTDHIHGKALTAGVSGDYIDVLLSTAALKGVALDGRAVYEDFSGYAATDLVANIQPDGTAADGTTTVLNHCYTPGGNVFAYHPIGTQTLHPAMVAGALDIGCDQTDDEGCEIYTNFLKASGMGPFVVGISPAFYFKCKLNVTLTNGTDDLQVGFRKAELIRAAWDDYYDAAAMGIITVANPAAVYIQTILANAATVETDTTDTWDDATDAEFAIFVSSAGVVTYQHDLASAGTLAAPTVTAAYTFADGTPVIPFVRFLNANAAQVGGVKIIKWEVGYQN